MPDHSQKQRKRTLFSRGFRSVPWHFPTRCEVDQHPRGQVSIIKPLGVDFTAAERPGRSSYLATIRPKQQEEEEKSWPL